MKIHFIGIGGIGVSALAQYYLAKGHQVSGSDLTKSEITDFLKKKGAKIIISNIKYQKSKLQIKIQKFIKQSDLIIYSPAVPKNHPELKLAKNLGIKCLSYPQALGKLTKQYFTIAVAGTHGKSTVTAILSLILIKAGLDPTVILGTKLREFGNSNFRMGKPTFRGFSRVVPRGCAILVIEADEWQASFLNYFPKIIILTNIEREHLDYYKNMAHILRTYREFIGHLPRDGVLIANGKDRNIQKIIFNFQFSIFNFQKNKIKEKQKLRQMLKVPGEHNVLNALAALTCARVLKIPDKISFKVLSEYKGAWRRFEEKDLKIENCKLKIISDYAHHPTEIAATLKTAREKYLQKEIWCIFQPHQYQRTFYLFRDFVKVFRKAPIDKLIITDIYDVAGREVKNLKKKVDSKKLVEAIGKSYTHYLPKTEIVNYLKKSLKGGEIVIVMGAGNIYEIIKEFK
ncbi:UDP-N-acetylmuramate--L-alanine ligase [bacterium]|nr:UDP-N-acetylmuramate--L-alanine ligase [bacterium]